MADNHQELLDVGGDDIFVYTGGRAPRDVRRAKIDESVDTIPSQLIEVKGHNKLKKIERSAFLRCRSLRWVSQMNGVKEIEASAFCGCYALSELEFDKLEIIGEASLCYCKSLRSINMPSVRRIGASAFQGCKQLSDAVFGKDLEGIGGGAFWSCTALRRIAIPLKDAFIVENTAFLSCESLSRVDVVGGIHETISSLHMESWRDEMREEMDGINQILPDVPSGREKTVAIKKWIRYVLDRMEHYKVEHNVLVKEAMTLLELALWKAKLEENGSNIDTESAEVVRKQHRVTCGANIVIKNVLPFLALK